MAKSKTTKNIYDKSTKIKMNAGYRIEIKVQPGSQIIIRQIPPKGIENIAGSPAVNSSANVNMNTDTNTSDSDTNINTSDSDTNINNKLGIYSTEEVDVNGFDDDNSDDPILSATRRHRRLTKVKQCVRGPGIKSNVEFCAPPGAIPPPPLLGDQIFPGPIGLPIGGPGPFGFGGFPGPFGFPGPGGFPGPFRCW